MKSSMEESQQRSDESAATILHCLRDQRRLTDLQFQGLADLPPELTVPKGMATTRPDQAGHRTRCMTPPTCQTGPGF